MKDISDKWYHNDVLGSAIFIGILFGIILLAIKLGASTQIATYIFIGGFIFGLGLCCLEPIQEAYNYLRKRHEQNKKH